jgi:predicted Fe-Mo cluster-binding NifX family protein
MKKIIASLGKELSSWIASNSARALYFLVVENDVLIEVIDNPFKIWWWAWFAVAELLKDKWCDLFIAGKIWDNLEKKLKEYNINYEIK